MKQSRKFLALITVLALLMGLCACGSSSSATTSSASPASEPAEEASVAEIETAVQEEIITEPEMEEDVSAEEVSETAEEGVEEPSEDPIVVEDTGVVESLEIEFVNEPIDLPISTDGISLTFWTQFMPPLTNFGINSNDDMPIYEHFEEITGVHMDFTCVSMDQAATAASLLIASGDYPEIWNSFYNYYGSNGDMAIEEGIVLDLTEYRDQLKNYFGLIDSNDRLSKYAYTENGSAAYFGCLYRTPDAKNGSAIRGDWLDALGLDMPVTYDDYYDTLVAMKNEFGGTYYLNTNGEAVFGAGYNVAVAIGATANSSGMFLLDDNKDIYYCGITEEFRDYLKYMHGLYEAGVLYENFSTNTDQRVDTAAVAAGDYSLVGGFTATLYSTVESYLEEGSDFRLEGISPVVQNEGDMIHLGDEPTYITLSGGRSLTTSLLADEEKLNAALLWMDYMYTEEGSNLCAYGMEGETYNMVNGERVFTDLVLNNPNGMAFTMAMMVYGMGNGAFVADPTVNTISYSDNALALYSKYVENMGASDYSAIIPAYVTMTSGESDTFSNTYSDIATYMNEAYLKFILGDLNLEGDFDEYCANVKAMGLDTCCSALQSAVDRAMK